MPDHSYETANQTYPWCFKIRGSLKVYIHARNWALDNLGHGDWTSTWTQDSSDYMDDQLRDWLFLFKSRDKYMLFMLTWHDVQV